MDKKDLEKANLIYEALLKKNLAVKKEDFDKLLKEMANMQKENISFLNKRLNINKKKK